MKTKQNTEAVPVIGQHTPGPWWLSQHGDSLIVTSNYGWVVGNAIMTHQHDSTRQANARLIAAAPELLEALKGIYEYANAIRSPGILNVEMKAARAAIARAERGEK